MCGMIDAKPKVGYFLSSKKGNRDILEKLLSIRLSDIKSLPVAVTESTSVYDSIVTIFLENVGTLFVVEKDVLKGAVSRKDLLNATMSGGDLSTIPVGVIMTRTPKIVCCIEDESVISADEKIIDNEVDCLPIVEILSDGKMKAIGRVSKTNITKVMMDISR